MTYNRLARIEVGMDRDGPYILLHPQDYMSMSEDASAVKYTKGMSLHEGQPYVVFLAAMRSSLGCI